ncbi:LysR family transcriptional regulator [Luteimonas sp. XNQY3]|nr:LysR family transcriptional regulator [Luteimonas sp. XNQY3]MCD9006461.1 LysR family transcriptional regulator [Luteimonas sp. XNQY3]
MSSNERLQHKVAGIEEFVRVAETLSFRRAADSLGQASSAVSRAIRQLEERLGVRLFHRTTRSVSLTDEGATLYVQASRWLGELDDMRSLFNGDPADLSGSIRIDLPMTFGRELVMPHLARFLDEHPRLSVEVRLNDHHVNLVAEAVDLALRIGELGDSELVVRPLGTVALGTFICPQCLDRHGRPQVPEDLLSHRLIAFMPPSGRPKPMLYRQGSEEIAIDTRHCVASFTNGEAMMSAVAAGVGIAQIPAFYAQRGLAQGRLVQVLAGQDAPGPSMQLVYPSRRQLPRRVRALVAFLADAVEQALVGSRP